MLLKYKNFEWMSWNIYKYDIQTFIILWSLFAPIHIAEENYGEFVTIVRRQRFKGGFGIIKKYSKKWAGVSPQKCGPTPPGGKIQNGHQQNKNKLIV